MIFVTVEQTASCKPRPCRIMLLNTQLLLVAQYASDEVLFKISGQINRNAQAARQFIP